MGYQAMKSRKLTLSLLRYLWGIGSYFEDHEGEPPPSDFEVFRSDALHTKREAIAAGDLDDLRSVVDAVLAHEDSWLWQFNHVLADFINDTNSQDEEYLRDLVGYYRSIIWPDAPPIDPEHPPDVELNNEPLTDWRRKRDAGEL